MEEPFEEQSKQMLLSMLVILEFFKNRVAYSETGMFSVFIGSSQDRVLLAAS